MTILVFSENKDLSLQLLGKARELADNLGTTVSYLSFGFNSSEFIDYGADKVYHIEKPETDSYDVESYKSIILEAVKISEPSYILIGATKRGKELAPRIAAALGVGCMNDCSDIILDQEHGVVVEKLTYGGSTVARETSNSETSIITVPDRTFEIPEVSTRTGEVTSMDVSIPKPRVNIVEKREKSSLDTGLERASIIISAGRGVKNKQDLVLLEELAKVLDGQVGCTRPISADQGWMDEWVGISGKKVNPKLYVACGISGTIQHAAGIRESQIIVSINTDESAPIHKLSDYSIVGDLYTIVPALTKALEKRI